MRGQFCEREGDLLRGDKLRQISDKSFEENSVRREEIDDVQKQVKY